MDPLKRCSHYHTEPSPTLLNLLGVVAVNSQDSRNTFDMQVVMAQPTAAIGTTVALPERGSTCNVCNTQDVMQR